MAELKNMTVQALRDLARKALGRGYSKLKTKSELIAALQAAEKKVAGAAGKAANKVRDATGRAARATEKVMDSVRGKKPKPAAPRPAPGARKAAGASQPDAGRRPPRGEAAGPPPAERRPARAVAAEPEPDPEGFMVARVVGEDAAHGAPHPLTERKLEAERPARAAARRAPPPAFEEGLGELPTAYGDDALMALPRDPKTLFLYWDHGQDTLRAAWEGLDGGRPQLWIFAREPDGGWTRVRVLDFALESRSYYIHDLEPGRIYRAEVHVVDRQGREKLVPRGSNEMMLPPVGPSPIIDDRFMRILWSEPLQRLLRDTRAGGAFPEDVRQQLARLSDWSRFAGRVWGGSGGMGGGRPFSATSSPSRPSSPSRRDDGEGH
jgi:hypothetical protein